MSDLGKALDRIQLILKECEMWEKRCTAESLSLANAVETIDSLKSAISISLTHLRKIGSSMDVTSKEQEDLLIEISKCHDDLKSSTLSAIEQWPA